MLVLSRREGEKIRIGDSVVITVVRASGDKVRIGIEAPADMLVLREELEPRNRGRSPSLEVQRPPIKAAVGGTSESPAAPIGMTVDPSLIGDTGIPAV